MTYQLDRVAKNFKYLSSSGNILCPVRDLKDSYGGHALICVDDNCYVLYIKTPTGYFYPTTHWFVEALQVMQTLPYHPNRATIL